MLYITLLTIFLKLKSSTATPSWRVSISWRFKKENDDKCSFQEFYQKKCYTSATLVFGRESYLSDSKFDYNQFQQVDIFIGVPSYPEGGIMGHIRMKFQKAIATIQRLAFAFQTVIPNAHLNFLFCLSNDKMLCKHNSM